MRPRINDPVLALPVVFVVLHAGGWFAMLASQTSWIYEWKSALDYVAGSVIIVGPLVASIAAATYALRGRTSLPDLAAMSVRPARGWYDPAMRTWLVSVLSLVVLVVEVTVLAVAHGLPVGPRQLMVLPFAAVMLLVHVLVGSVIGLHVRPLVAPPLAGVVSFGLFILATDGHAPAAFMTGGSTDSLAGEQYRASAVALLTVVAVALVVAGIAGSGWWRLGAVPVVVIAVALGASVAASKGVTSQGGPIEFAKLHFRCAGSAPQVCVASETPRVLPDAARRMHALARPLRAIGVELPERWKESLYSTSPDRAAGYLDLDPTTGTKISTEDALGSLTMPATCSGFGAEEPERSIDSRLLLEDWLGVRNGRAPEGAQRSWAVSRASETWVRATYRLLRECRLDELRAP